MCPTSNYRYILRQAMVSLVTIRMEVFRVSLKKFFRMLCSTTGLVFIQNNGLIRLPTGSIQPHIAVTLRFLPRLMGYLQGSLICMEDISGQQFLCSCSYTGVR